MRPLPTRRPPRRSSTPAPAASSSARASGDWYVIHSYAGYENKVKANLETRVQNLDVPGRGSDRRGHRDQERPAQEGQPQGAAGLHPGPHGAQRRVVGRRAQHPGRHRLRGHDQQAVAAVARRGPAVPHAAHRVEKGRSPARLGRRGRRGRCGRRGVEQHRGRLRGRRVGHRHGRSVRDAARLHQRGQRGAAQGQGARLDLRS